MVSLRYLIFHYQVGKLSHISKCGPVIGSLAFKRNYIQVFIIYRRQKTCFIHQWGGNVAVLRWTAQHYMLNLIRFSIFRIPRYNGILAVSFWRVLIVVFESWVCFISVLIPSQDHLWGSLYVSFQCSFNGFSSCGCKYCSSTIRKLIVV